MSEPVFVIDTSAPHPTKVQPVSLAVLGIKERSDFQRWVLREPSLLGERLLPITSEFDSFDRSSRRLDVLALDEDATLVIVELKLDARGSHADLQAIRYAAFCSTMTIDQIVAEFAEFHACSRDEASVRILTFLDAQELPKLEGEPRIILAAGSMDDQELTASVLWLRRFNLDITCVELTAYQVPGVDGKIIVVPRTIIPIPEARDYMVRVEQKEAATALAHREDLGNRPYWKSLAEEFNKLGVTFGGSKLEIASPASWGFQKVSTGLPNVLGRTAHFEWCFRRRAGFLDVGIDFEDSDESVNARFASACEAERARIAQDVDEELLIGSWGDERSHTKWRQVRFRLPSKGPSELETVPRAAKLMQILMTRALPILARVGDEIESASAAQRAKGGC